jgi:hypothetical protein
MKTFGESMDKSLLGLKNKLRNQNGKSFSIGLQRKEIIELGDKFSK